MRLIIALLLVLMLFCVWVILYDSTRFVTVRYQFADKRIKKKCRALLLADLHNKCYGKENALLLETIDECQPDVILIAGDILTATPGKSLEPAILLLRKLQEKYPIYYANGNHEYRLKLYPETYGNMAEEYEKALKEIGLERLVNERVELPEYGIEIFGSEIDKKFYERFHAPEMETDYLCEIMGTPKEEMYSILLAHKPDYFPQYARWGANLTLSGHVHGGVIRVPLFGKGVISPSLGLFPKYDGGLFHEQTAQMVLSRGLGAHTIPFRMFNPAELVVIELEPGSYT